MGQINSSYLFDAIRALDENKVQHALDKGVSPHLADDQDRSPFLQLFCSEGGGDAESSEELNDVRFKIAEMLLERDVNINAMDNRSWTALHYAAQNCEEDQITFLIQKGAIVNVVDNYGRTPKSLCPRGLRGDRCCRLLEEVPNSTLAYEVTCDPSFKATEAVQIQFICPPHHAPTDYIQILYEEKGNWKIFAKIGCFERIPPGTRGVIEISAEKLSMDRSYYASYFNSVTNKYVASTRKFTLVDSKASTMGSSSSTFVRHNTIRSESTLESIEVDENIPLMGTRRGETELKYQNSILNWHSTEIFEHNTLVVNVDYDVAQKCRRTKSFPFFMILFIIAQLITFAYSLYYNNKEFNSPIEMDPFNPSVGPFNITLIQLGAKYTPCITETDYFNPPTCPPGSKESYPPQFLERFDEFIACGDLERYCGMGGNLGQWWRYIVPIFLNNGAVPLFVNLLAEIFIAIPLERGIGSFRMALIFLSSGIFGYVVSASFYVQMPSTGASGALFGVFVAYVMDLVLHAHLAQSYFTNVLIFCGSSLVYFALGITAAFDNFSHLGGLLIGIFSSLVLLPKINSNNFIKWYNFILVIISLVCYLGLLIYPFYRIYHKEPDFGYCDWCPKFDCVNIPYISYWCL